MISQGDEARRGINFLVRAGFEPVQLFEHLVVTAPLNPESGDFGQVARILKTLLVRRTLTSIHGVLAEGAKRECLTERVEKGTIDSNEKDEPIIPLA
jgi:hypothetical protein